MAMWLMIWPQHGQLVAAWQRYWKLLSTPPRTCMAIAAPQVSTSREVIVWPDQTANPASRCLSLFGLHESVDDPINQPEYRDSSADDGKHRGDEVVPATMCVLSVRVLCVRIQI